jgi:hypothetical protein
MAVPDIETRQLPVTFFSGNGNKRFIDVQVATSLLTVYVGVVDCPFLTVYVGVVECAPASPYTYSSSTHRFPDEHTPIEASPLSATSAELGSGLGLDLGLGSHFSSHAPSHSPLLLPTLLSHNTPFPRVH